MEVKKMKHFFKLTPIFVLLVLAVTYLTSIPAMAKSDYWTDSGGQYNFYLDYMFPKRNVGPKPQLIPPKKLTVNTSPRSDIFTDSGSQYGFYLDYMLPKRNVGPKPAVHPVKKITVDTKTVYDYSPTPNDFYLDWMRPRIKPDPMSRKSIRFLTRQASDAENQFVSNQNNK